MASEPPHSVPTIRSAGVSTARSACEACCSSLTRMREPCSMVSMSPPHSLILIASAGLPDLAISSATM